MSKDINLKAIHYFETAARRGTLTLAAEELSVSPSAVSQQVKLLEQQMGIKLFRRDGRRLCLTLEGEQLFQASYTAIRLLRDARRHLGSSQSTWRLNIRVSPSFGVRWLGPRLSSFVEANSDWDLRVDAAPDPTDFEREIMDLDIRYGLGGWQGSYHAEAVVQDRVLPLCSPEYRDSLLDDGATEDSLLQHARLIDSARALCQWDYWLTRHGFDTVGNDKAILLDRSSMALQLASDGVGVVLESLTLAAAEVHSGRLVPITPHIPVVSFPAYWIICPSRNLDRKAVQVFIHWMKEAINQHDLEVNDWMASHQLREEHIDGFAELACGQASAQ